MSMNLQERLRPLLTLPFLPDVALVLVRIVTGALLVWHGASKVFDGFGPLMDTLATRGWPAPALQAVMASYIEFAGGVLLIVGLFTRPTALAVMVLFTIITFVFHADDPFKVQEKAFLFLLLGTYLFLVGPGKFSIDSRLFGKGA
jgi:putative oxidoreductase